MPSYPFWSNIFRRRDKEETDVFDILKKVPIFQDLSRREFNKIESILHRRNWNADEAIINEGDPGLGMYIIVAGEVRITQVGEDGVQQQLATLTGGDFFGEQALLDESPRTASAYANEPCRIIGFFRPDLLELIERNPRLGLIDRKQSSIGVEDRNAAFTNDIGPLAAYQPVVKGGENAGETGRGRKQKGRTGATRNRG